MIFQKGFLVLFALLLPLIGCRNEVDEKKVEAKFTKLWEEYKQARLKGDVEAAMMFHPPGHQVLLAANGDLQWISYEEAKKNMKRRYAKIEDLVPPIVKVSSCGYCVIMAGRTRFVTAATDSTEEETEEEAWISTFEQDDGNWQQIASSNGVENPSNLPTGIPLDTD